MGGGKHIVSSPRVPSYRLDEREREREKAYSPVNVRGKLDAGEGHGPFLQLLFVGHPGICFQAHETMLTVIQQFLRDFIALVHPFGQVQPAAILIQDCKLGIDEFWFFVHKLVDW